MLPYDRDDEYPDVDHEYDDGEWRRWYDDCDVREPIISPSLPEIVTIDPGDFL